MRYLKCASLFWNSLESNGTGNVTFGQLNLTGTDESLNIFRLDSANLYGSGLSLSQLNGINIIAPINSTILINVEGANILYGSLPDLGTMGLFCFLLGVFAIGAPGVPGGTVMASLGLITGVVGFDETGTALILTIFALQDSFGTACIITGDGALTMILTGYARKHDIKEQKIELEL